MSGRASSSKAPNFLEELEHRDHLCEPLARIELQVFADQRSVDALLAGFYYRVRLEIIRGSLDAFDHGPIMPRLSNERHAGPRIRGCMEGESTSSAGRRQPAGCRY